MSGHHYSQIWGKNNAKRVKVAQTFKPHWLRLKSIKPPGWYHYTTSYKKRFALWHQRWFPQPYHTFQSDLYANAFLLYPTTTWRPVWKGSPASNLNKYFCSKVCGWWCHQFASNLHLPKPCSIGQGSLSFFIFHPCMDVEASLNFARKCITRLDIMPMYMSHWRILVPCRITDDQWVTLPDHSSDAQIYRVSKQGLARHTLHISRTSLPIILTQICGVCIFRLHPKKGYRTHAMITHVVLHDAHKYKRSNCHMEITRLPDVFCFLPSTACYLMKLRLTCHAAKCSWWPQSWISARQSDQNILQTFCVWMFVLIIGFPVRKHLKLHPFVTCRVLKK